MSMGQKCIALIVIIATLSYTVGCTSMRTLPREEMSNLAEREKVLVKTEDGMEYLIKEPWIQDSKLMGFVEEEGHKEIELSKIQSMKAEELHPVKTLIATVVLTTGGILLISVIFRGILFGAGSDSSDDSSPGAEDN